MSELLPWLHKEATRIGDLEFTDMEDIPDVSGVYIMVSENTDYIYPWHKSRVFYIGQSGKSLRTRIWEHRKYYLEARDAPRHNYYWSRYEYPAAHGCKICWIRCRDAQSAKGLEKQLLIDFANYYGAKPVGNNQGAW